MASIPLIIISTMFGGNYPDASDVVRTMLVAVGSPGYTPFERARRLGDAHSKVCTLTIP